MVAATPVTGFTGCCGALGNFNYQPGLAAIKRPVLVVAGSKDQMLAGPSRFTRYPGFDLCRTSKAPDICRTSISRRRTTARSTGSGVERDKRRDDHCPKSPPARPFR